MVMSMRITNRGLSCLSAKPQKVFLVYFGIFLLFSAYSVTLRNVSCTMTVCSPALNEALQHFDQVSWLLYNRCIARTALLGNAEVQQSYFWRNYADLTPAPCHQLSVAVPY
jgi:hypothetical protein